MRVLALGWDPRTAKACQELGVSCVMVVGPDMSPSLLSTPGVIAVPVTDPANMEAVLLALFRGDLVAPGFDVVYTDEESALITAAALGQHFGISAIPVRTAVGFRDKYVQKRRVAAAGVPVADNKILNGDEIADAMFPAVLKPVDGSAARLTTLVNSSDQLKAAVADLRSKARPNQVLMIERFVPGREVHVDGVVRNHSLIFASVGRYPDNLLASKEGAVPGSIILDPSRHRDAYERIVLVAQRALTALGLSDGVIHMELFDDGDTVWFGECAARCGGAMVDSAVEAKFGIDLHREGVAAAVGGRLPPVPAPVSTAVGFTFLPAPKGQIITMPSAGQVERKAGVLRATMRISPGDCMLNMRTDTSTRAGIALMEAENEESLAERLTELAQWFFDHTKTVGTSWCADV